MTSTRTEVAATPTACAIGFSDVQPTDYFYDPVRYLYCRNVVSGYVDGSFRPYNLTTRGQAAKMIVLVEGWPVYTPATPTFRDVTPTHAFFGVIETAAQRGIFSGYSCGASCLQFNSGDSISRGQLAKVVVLARGWPISTPPSPTFRDAQPGYVFYPYIETAYSRGLISGYLCGTGCVEFRPGNNSLRAQVSKILYNAVTQP